MIHVVGPPLTRAGARAAARRELSKGIYHRNDEPWQLRLLHWIGRWIDRVTSSVSRHSPGGAAGAIALVALLLILVAVARWRLGPVQRTRRAAPGLLGDRTATAAEHRAAAETAAAAGQWNDAVLARMRALARELEERGELDERPGRTARELAAEVTQERPDLVAEDLAPDVSAAADVFDTTVYGGRTATAASYAVVARADDAARRRARALSS